MHNLFFSFRFCIDMVIIINVESYLINLNCCCFFINFFSTGKRAQLHLHRGPKKQRFVFSSTLRKNLKGKKIK